MRTTLKRGMGRAAAVNGNGRPVLPPGVVAPMRRYRQPDPPRRTTRRLVTVVFGWVALVLLIVAAGLAGGLYLYLHETLNAIAPKTKALKSTQPDLVKLPSASAPAIGLIIGYDARAGADAFGASGSRSDTIMLVRADPQTNTLSLLSFPRDLVVPIYCNPDTVDTHDRINTAWTICGPRGTLDTVEKLTGLSINYLVTLDFHGFKLLVNKLHGVYVDVDHRYLNTQGGPGGYATINLQPGYQKLDGQQALDFVRSRHTDDDTYRNARQQLFVESLKDRLASSLSITEIPQVIGAMKDSLTVVRSAGGAPSLNEIEAYAGLAYHLPAGHQFRTTITGLQPYGIQGAELIAPTSSVDTAVSTFEHPDVTLAKRANDAALGIKEKPKKHAAELTPAQISTLVLNGTTYGGFARDTSYKLAVAGYHTVLLPTGVRANAPVQNYTSTYVYYDPVQPNAKRAAQILKQAMGAHTLLAPMTSDIAALAQQAGNPMTVVALGTSFGGEITSPQQTKVETPTHETPSVSTPSSTVLSDLQQVRAGVPFPLLQPTQVAAGSYLSSLEGVRAFKPIAGKHEVALTFVLPVGNVYWQIIETNWNDAPILRRPTGTYERGGKRIQLFTTSGHVHMAVVRTARASYWVVNTLKDELTNETMIAIAKSLRPLSH
jgi:LCP family protein required for cell wall assembly